VPKPLCLLAVAAILLAAGVMRGLAADSPLSENLHAELNPPSVAGVTVRGVTATGAEIEWPASLAAADRFRVELRRFSLGEARELRMDWVEAPGVPVSRHGEHFRARLRDLIPRQPYWIRVLPRGSAEPLFAVRFDTPAKKSVFTVRRTAIGVLLAALVALLWLRRRR
jgi:hypothetical protein